MSEAEQHWRLFLERQIDRGLQDIRLIISDDHSGLRKARRLIFNAPDRTQAEGYLKQIVVKYEDIASELADWMEEAIPEGLTLFGFSERHDIRIRTSNMLERVSQEIKRRTRVVRIFPNQSACLRLVSAILMEISEDWETGRIYLNIEPD